MSTVLKDNPIHLHDDDIPNHELRDLLHGGPSEDCAMTFMCRGKRFHVAISPKDLQDHEREYARLIMAMNEDEVDSDSEPNDPLDNLGDWVLPPFYSIFSKLAPMLPQTLQRTTLAESFNPPTFFFRLKSVDGVLTAVRADDIHEDVKFWSPSMDIDPSLFRPGLSLVRPSDLEITWDPRKDCCPPTYRVSLSATEHYFLKQTFPGIEPSITREADILLRLQDLGVAEKIRIPKLHGFVQDEGEIKIMGLLLTQIEAQGTLSSVVLHDHVSKAMRVKWMGEIETGLKSIHQAGVVWGDVKADNVLIDTDNNAWIIDFGGGYTQGWVEEEQKETVEGDLSGLEKIREFLGLAS